MCAVLEEEYQACAKRREEKESILNDARAELEALIADVERYTEQISQLKREEDKAKDISSSSHPDTVSQLRERVDCALCVFAPPTLSAQVEQSTETPVSDTLPTTDTMSTSESNDTIMPTEKSDTTMPTIEEVENMDTSTCFS